jgi:hypothetical protein
MTSPLLTSPPELAYEFPPALVRLVRERLTPRSGCLSDVTDDVLARLLTTIFFAGLETYDGEHNPIGVAFLGRSAVDFVVAESAAAEALPLYQWKILRFASPRPLATPELVKLGVGGIEHRIYSAVGLLDDGRLAITGLAREGFNGGPDPFVKIIASRPGCLSIRSGRDLVIEYDRGSILAFGEDERFSAGPVHLGLEAIARSAGVDDDVVPHYLDAVVFLVHEILSHGRGGILIISGEELTTVAESAPYRMIPDSSLAALLRLAWRAGHNKRAGTPENRAFGQLLRNACLTEAERFVEELGRLTAMDGAVLLNRDLALVAFGVVLPVGGQIAVAEGVPSTDGSEQIVDFGRGGTRHRAGATYAWEHPGSIVFVASEDGQVSCLLRGRFDEPVRLWRLAPGRLTPGFLGG